MPNPKYRVLRPVSLRLQRCDGGWLASSDWLNDWGFGVSQSDAMLNFMRSMCDVYELLSESSNGPFMETLLKRLKTYIEPR